MTPAGREVTVKDTVTFTIAGLCFAVAVVLFAFGLMRWGATATALGLLVQTL